MTMRRRDTVVAADNSEVQSLHEKSERASYLSTEIAPRFPQRDLLDPTGLVRFSRFESLYRMDMSLLFLIFALSVACLVLIYNIKNGCGHSSALQERDIGLQWAFFASFFLIVPMVFYAYNMARSLVDTGGELNGSEDAVYKASVATWVTLIYTVVEIYAWFISVLSLISAASSVNNPCENRGFYTILASIQFVTITAHLYVVLYQTSWRVFHNVYMVYAFQISKVSWEAVSAKKPPKREMPNHHVPPVPEGWRFHADPKFMRWFTGEEE